MRVWGRTVGACRVPHRWKALLGRWAQPCSGHGLPPGASHLLGETKTHQNDKPGIVTNEEKRKEKKRG